MKKYLYFIKINKTMLGCGVAMVLSASSVQAQSFNYIKLQFGRVTRVQRILDFKTADTKTRPLVVIEGDMIDGAYSANHGDTKTILNPGVLDFGFYQSASNNTPSEISQINYCVLTAQQLLLNPGKGKFFVQIYRSENVPETPGFFDGNARSPRMALEGYHLICGISP